RMLLLRERRKGLSESEAGNIDMPDGIGGRSAKFYQPVRGRHNHLSGLNGALRWPEIKNPCFAIKTPFAGLVEFFQDILDYEAITLHQCHPGVMDLPGQGNGTSAGVSLFHRDNVVRPAKPGEDIDFGLRWFSPMAW